MPSTQNFSDQELRCKCGCKGNLMDQAFLDEVLQPIRDEFGRPMLLTSAYRCPEYNDFVSSTGRTGPHTTGRAVDVLVSGPDAHFLIELAFDFGVRGIGIMQRGPHKKRYLHLDNLDQQSGPRPFIWSY
jgi:zinc D-Ala-D-Ala carboxypeptidase